MKFDEFEYLGDGWFRFPLTPRVVALAQVQKRGGRSVITYLVFSGDVGSADSARAIRRFPLARAGSVLGEAADNLSESGEGCDLVASIERVAY